MENTGLNLLGILVLLFDNFLYHYVGEEEGNHLNVKTAKFRVKCIFHHNRDG